MSCVGFRKYLHAYIYEYDKNAKFGVIFGEFKVVDTYSILCDVIQREGEIVLICTTICVKVVTEKSRSVYFLHYSHNFLLSQKKEQDICNPSSKRCLKPIVLNNLCRNWSFTSSSDR
jgi:hypothetical protein